MNFRRILRHLLVTPWRVRRAFPRAALAAIERAVQASEPSHSGQIRFAVEGALHGARLFGGQTPRQRALEVFSFLRMWDTEHRNGVLIYLLLADRAVEIVADRGAHAHIGGEEWRSICRTMEEHFRAREYERGAVRGIEAVARHLARQFPGQPGEVRELPERPIVL